MELPDYGFFDGSIDEVAVYSPALLDDRVQVHHDTASP